jgi:hypothetical protein
MPYSTQGTAYNKNFVVNEAAPLSTEVPRGNHTHTAASISYDNTGSTIISSLTAQGAISALDSRLATFALAEKSKLSAGMTDSTYTVTVGGIGVATIVNASMTTLAGSKNALYSNGIKLNYAAAPEKLIEGQYSASVSITAEASTQYAISVLVDGVTVGSSFKSMSGATTGGVAGTFSISISTWLSGLTNGSTLALAVYNMTSTSNVVLRSMVVSFAGQPEGAIVASSALVNHVDVIGRDSLGQHPITAVYEAGSGRTLQLVLDDKMDKIDTVVTDNVLTMDSTGNAQDSGISKITVLNHMDKVSLPTLDNIITMTSTGNSKDGGLRVSDLALVGGNTLQPFNVGSATAPEHAERKEVVDALVIEVDGKIPLVPTPTVDNYVKLAVDGSLVDSGTNAGTFAPIVHTHVIADITSLQDTLDNKYNKVALAVTGNFPVFGAGNVLLDSGSAYVDVGTFLEFTTAYEA